MERWPHQLFGTQEALAAIERGERRICVTSPTGGGKTTMMCDLIEHWTGQGLKCAVYTNRKLLIEQTSRVLSHAGIDHGTRASGYIDDGYFPVQLCSIQTEDSRVFKAQKWALHDADRIIIDEAHNQTGKVARRILDTHHQEGAAYVGFTATPLGIGELYDTLITAGTTSELRACGALVPAQHFGCDEPDLKHIGKVELGRDLTEKQNRKAIMVPGIFGRVLEWFEKLNPERRPTILFAPGVAESIWFAEQFTAAGISAAHIDGQEVWFNGNLERSDRKARSRVLAGSKAGSICVLCNRYVLREGIDAPWLGHGIFATVYGSLGSYLQSGGRILRAHPDLESVTIQDHGGNWWRHGSLNADRQWRLDWTPGIAAGMREDALREHREREPVRCPQCGLILLAGHCKCGWEVLSGRKSRPVIQADGSLKEMRGDIFKPRRISNKTNGPQLWEQMYWRSRTAKGARTFRAAFALFASENNWGYPDPAWPFMPLEVRDQFRLVSEVPMDRLIPKR